MCNCFVLHNLRCMYVSVVNEIIDKTMHNLINLFTKLKFVYTLENLQNILEAVFK